MNTYAPTVTTETFNYLGKHVLLDLWDCDPATLSDPSYVEKTLRSAAIAAGATILSGHFHHFGEGCGVTGVLVLSESHISIHSWPEFGHAALDVFVCGDANPEDAAPVLRKMFRSKTDNYHVVRRGIIPEGVL